MKHPYTLLIVVLALLISPSLIPVAAQDLPRAEMILKVDWTNVESAGEPQDSVVDALQQQLEWEGFSPTEVVWMDGSRLRAVMPVENIYDVEDVLDLLSQ